MKKPRKIAGPMTRRGVLKTFGAAPLATLPYLSGFAARAASGSDVVPRRFVFVIRANGILPPELQPVGLEGLVKVRGNGGWGDQLVDRPLEGMALSAGTAPLEPFKDRVTVLQGLSGRMCSASHNAGYGALGAYKSQGQAPPPGITVDAMLAAHLDAPFPHLGFAMEQFGPQVTYPPISAAGAGKALPFYADPVTAYGDLFGSVLTDAQLKAAVAVDRNVLDFMSADVRRFRERLPGQEREKMDVYLDGFDSLRERGRRLAKMEAQLKAAAPELKEHYHSEIETERLDAHFELATSALVGGLSNVVTVRADNLEMRLTGLGLGEKTVHHIGHMIEGKSGGGGGEAFADGKGEFATRELILKYHMEHVAVMAAKLDSIPEGDGTMLDHTTIVYMSDHGDRHHSKFYEWPMVVVGNAGGAFRAGRYLQVPGYREAGHATIGHLYVSLLRAAGVEAETFGQPDRSLPAGLEQRGPLEAWMA